MLEAGGCDDLEDPGGLVTGVPKRVPLVAGLEDEVARTGLEDFLAEQRAHASFEHVAVFVLTRMTV